MSASSQPCGVFFLPLALSTLCSSKTHRAADLYVGKNARQFLAVQSYDTVFKMSGAS